MKLVRLVAIAGLLLSSFVGTSIAADVTGRAFITGSAGTLFFISDDQMNGSAIWENGIKHHSNTKPRLFADIGFGFVFKRYLSSVVRIGFGWEAYSFDKLRVATARPLTVGVEYRLGSGKYVPRAGAGVGYYVWSVLEDRKVMKDPITREERKRGDPGIYGTAGFDYFARPNLAICTDVFGHHVFAKDTQAFPSGYAYNKDILTITLGLKYFFAPR